MRTFTTGGRIVVVFRKVKLEDFFVSCTFLVITLRYACGCLVGCFDAVCASRAASLSAPCTHHVH